MSGWTGQCRIAVIGAGVIGLGTAKLLSRRHHATVLEPAGRPAGHARPEVPCCPRDRVTPAHAKLSPPPELGLVRHFVECQFEPRSDCVAQGESRTRRCRASGQNAGARILPTRTLQSEATAMSESDAHPLIPHPVDRPSAQRDRREAAKIPRRLSSFSALAGGMRI